MNYFRSASVSSQLSSSSESNDEYESIVCEMKKGDLLEIDRGVYKHWVMVESICSDATVWCFHVTTVERDQEQFQNEKSFNGKAVLKYEPLIDILRDTVDGSQSPFKVNNQEHMARKHLAKSGKRAPDLSKVLQTLHVVKDRVVMYNIKSLNCEHYSTFWKYGIGWSSQVNTVQKVSSSVFNVCSTVSLTLSEMARSDEMRLAGFLFSKVSDTILALHKNNENILQADDIEIFFCEVIVD